MEVSFKFESDDFFSNDLCNEMEITINVFTRDGEDFEWNLVSIYDTTSDQFRKLLQFSEEEQERIEALCEQTAEEHYPDAYDRFKNAKAYKNEDVW